MNRKMRETCGARGGFTMAELLIVITIIVILTTILIPVVSKVKRAAHTATVQHQIQGLAETIERYHQDFGAYPGPLSNDEVYNCQTAGGTWPPGVLPPPIASFTLLMRSPPPLPAYVTKIPLDTGRITGNENLVLGLLGGLWMESTAGGPALHYDPSLVGSGPTSLNMALPKQYPPYIDSADLAWQLDPGTGLKTGAYRDDAAAGGHDSLIPELVDRFPDRMPILYLRARVGLDQIKDPSDVLVRISVIRRFVPPNNTPNLQPVQQYDAKDIWAYTAPDGISGTTGHYLGVGRKQLRDADLKLPGPVSRTGSETPHGLQTVISPPECNMSVSAISSLEKTPPPGRTYYYPYDGWAYFESPNLRYDPVNRQAEARKKDTFILISAGADRIYGTEDDITSFGEVAP